MLAAARREHVDLDADGIAAPLLRSLLASLSQQLSCSDDHRTNDDPQIGDEEAEERPADEGHVMGRTDRAGSGDFPSDRYRDHASDKHEQDESETESHVWNVADEFACGHEVAIGRGIGWPRELSPVGWAFRPTALRCGWRAV